MKGLIAMDLKQIEAFMKVVDYKSFTKAAESSYFSQPTLSKAIQKLEDTLNVQLLERSTKHLNLTDAGKIVYKQGQQTLASLNEIYKQLDELKNVNSGSINLGMPPLIGTLFFPEIARKFHQQYPNVKIKLFELGAKVVEELVEDGQIDAGLIVLPTDNDLFQIQPFIVDNFVLFVHRDHPIARYAEISLSALKDENFILFDKSFALHNYIINACKESGFNPTISYESSHWDLITELVASKLGVTLLPKSIFKKQSNPNVKMVPLKTPALKWKLAIITKRDAYHPFALKKFTEMFGSENANAK